ncbi:MAG: DUF6624 domain-containing protein [Bacteroidota bacterium]
MKAKLLILGSLIVNSLYSQDLDLIIKKLEKIEKENLELRNKVMPTVQEYGFKSPQMDSLDREIQYFDSVSLQIVTQIIDQYGWLGVKEIGEAGNRTLFLAIQHASDNSVRKKYFPLLEESAKNGDSYLSHMATMKDRMLVQDGKLQIYGTQSKMVDGELKPFPIENPENVNSRRKSVGLSELE